MELMVTGIARNNPAEDALPDMSLDALLQSAAILVYLIKCGYVFAD